MTNWLDGVGLFNILLIKPHVGFVKPLRGEI
jgi:hypothetical protein